MSSKSTDCFEIRAWGGENPRRDGMTRTVGAPEGGSYAMTSPGNLWRLRHIGDKTPDNIN